MPFPCIDIGVNLTHRSFRGDLTDVVYAAHDAGVEAMIVTGTSLCESQDATALAGTFRSTLYATVGVHPHHAKDFDERTIAELHELAGERSVVAIGECGLDFNRDFSPRDVQQVCFEAQLQLAADRQLPVFLHERDAHETFLPIMHRFRQSIPRGVVHCFTGTAEQADAYLEADLHLGITGWICDERRGQALREVVRRIPAERLMVETDAPFLTPRDITPRVKRNEPKNLPHILRVIAECRSEPVEPLAQRILATTRDFFGLD